MKTKYIITLVLVLSILLAKAQIVNIPDPQLKLILTTYPLADLGNGFNEIADTNGDGEIQESEAEAVLGLLLVEQYIEDLEGLQYFINLERMNCSENGLNEYVPTTFWPNLNFLHCGNNNITFIDVTQNPLLEELTLNSNPLTSLDVTQNPLLNLLGLTNCQFSDLDVSQNNLLETLHCNSNQLTSLDIQNENNNLLWSMIATGNPNLTCIQVDDVEYANNQPNWYKDETAIYSEDCSLGMGDVVLSESVYLFPNPVKSVLQISIQNNIAIKNVQVFDVLGKQLLQTNEINQIDVSVLTNGLLFVKITTDKGIVVKKVVKE